MRLDNKQDITKLRDAMNVALATIASELGLVKLRAGNVKYEAGGAGATIQVKAEAIVGGKTKAELAWDQYAEMYGLEPAWLHHSFEHRRGQMVEIIGLEPSRSRFPVVVQDATRGELLLTVTEVKSRMGKGGLTEVAPPPRT